MYKCDILAQIDVCTCVCGGGGVHVQCDNAMTNISNAFGTTTVLAVGVIYHLSHTACTTQWLDPRVARMQKRLPLQCLDDGKLEVPVSL